MTSSLIVSGALASKDFSVKVGQISYLSCYSCSDVWRTWQNLRMGGSDISPSSLSCVSVGSRGSARTANGNTSNRDRLLGG